MDSCTQLKYEACDIYKEIKTETENYDIYSLNKLYSEDNKNIKFEYNEYNDFSELDDLSELEEFVNIENDIKFIKQEYNNENEFEDTVSQSFTEHDFSEEGKAFLSVTDSDFECEDYLELEESLDAKNVKNDKTKHFKESDVEELSNTDHLVKVKHRVKKSKKIT